MMAIEYTYSDVHMATIINYHIHLWWNVYDDYHIHLSRGVYDDYWKQLWIDLYKHFRDLSRSL